MRAEGSNGTPFRLWRYSEGSEEIPLDPSMRSWCRLLGMTLVRLLLVLYLSDFPTLLLREILLAGNYMLKHIIYTLVGISIG